MNGIVEGATDTAKTVVEALRSTPAILALVIFNVMFMGLTTWTMIKIFNHFDTDSVSWERAMQSTLKLCAHGARDEILRSKP